MTPAGIDHPVRLDSLAYSDAIMAPVRFGPVHNSQSELRWVSLRLIAWNADVVIVGVSVTPVSPAAGLVIMGVAMEVGSISIANVCGWSLCVIVSVTVCAELGAVRVIVSPLMLADPAETWAA